MTNIEINRMQLKRDAFNDSLKQFEVFTEDYEIWRITIYTYGK